jgi:hypothetical protein
LPGAFTLQSSIAGCLVVQQEIQDDAGTDGNQHIVAACLDPVIAARRRAQVMAAPIVDNILAIAIFRWEAVASVECVFWTGTAFIAVIVTVIITMVAATVIAMVVLIAAVVIVMMIVSEGGASCRKQRDRHDGGNNGFNFHA